MGPSPDLVARFRRDLEALDGEAERIGVAVSGGPDSLALLLLAAAAFPGRIEAAPVDAPPAPADGAPATGDPGEDAYLAGYRLWERGSFADAQLALEAAAKKYPDHRRASFARNLAGRAALDAGKPATAAKLLLANYQEDPRGERAADSLYFLGQSLMALKKPADACKVYAELQDVYGTTLRDFLRQRLPEARAAAKCE